MSEINSTEMEDMPFNLSKDNADRLETIRLSVIKLWHEYDDKTGKIGKQKVRGWEIKYPPHDDTHSQKIQKILKKLLPDEQVVNKAFSDDEKFLLLAAVWLHDVGMNPELFGDEVPTVEGDKELRKVHNVRSAKWIKSQCAQLHLSEQECERLATIALLHRKAEKIPDDLDIKTRLIIAYLRLADALHIPNRAPLGELKTHLASGMDAVSKFHWFKSFYVIDSEPSEEEFKITVKFKKPISWNGNPEEDMSPLVDVLNTELKDEIDSVKSILLEGKLRLGLPAYIDIDSTFERTYMEEGRISELYELLAIIELFNPIMTPNSGAVVDIVLNQIKRYADRSDPRVSIDRLKDYRLNTLKPLLEDRPCHVYIWKVCKKLKDMLKELDKNISNPKQIIPDQWMTYTIDDIQKMIKKLQDKRKVLEKELPPNAFGVVTDTLYLFSWANVPGNDNEKLRNFLKDDLDIDWAENAEITKDDKTISITKGEYSAKIIMNEEEKKVTLAIRDSRTHLRVIEQDGKLNIYKNFLTSEDHVLVYGYSSSVIMTLNALPVDVKNEITVYVCECSTKTKYRYDNRLIYSDGIKYFRELKGVGIKNVKYVVDLCASNLFSIGEPTGAGRKFKRVTKVLFGANGIDKGYLFSWDNVPGSDSGRLFRYLLSDHDIGWAENAKMQKSDDGKTIRIFKNENSAEIIINEKEKKANLTISDGRTRNLKVKRENNKLNIYDESTEEVAHGLGHRAIADMATSHHIPVFVITESMRIGDLVENSGHMREGPWYPTDIWFDVIDVSNSYNPREERVPCKGLITNIITEKGVYPNKSLEAISSNIDDI